MNLIYLYGILHLIGLISISLYGLVINNYILDKLYIYIFLFIPLSWILCKDECLISYFIKKINNPKYILGSEPFNTNDITNLFYNKKVYYIFFHINHSIRMYSFYIVVNRIIIIDFYTIVITIILYTIYTYDILYNLNYRKYIKYVLLYLLLIILKLNNN